MHGQATVVAECTLCTIVYMIDGEEKREATIAQATPKLGSYNIYSIITSATLPG